MDTELHTATIYIEVYVKGRVDPLHWPLRIDVNETITSVGEIMIYASQFIEEILSDIREPYLTLVDERHSHHIVLKTEIQAYSLQAPDASFIDWVDEDA